MGTSIEEYLFPSTVIILGANYEELHVQKFIEQNKNKQIITVSDMPSTLGQPPPKCYHYNSDFNELSLWNKIQQTVNNHKVDIIVDVSTSKHMDAKWNFENGVIANIVLKMIRQANGSFTSPCCGNGFVFLENNIRKHSPLSYIATSPESLTDPTFSEFKEKLRAVMEKKQLSLTWKTIGEQNRYPIKNPHFQPTSSFFVLKRLNV